MGRGFAREPACSRTGATSHPNHGIVQYTVQYRISKSNRSDGLVVLCVLTVAVAGQLLLVVAVSRSC